MTITGFFKKFTKYLGYPFVAPYYGIMKAVNPEGYAHLDAFGNYKSANFTQMLDTAMTNQNMDEVARLVDEGIINYKSSTAGKDVFVQLFSKFHTLNSKPELGERFTGILSRLFNFIEVEEGKGGLPKEKDLTTPFMNNALEMTEPALITPMAELCDNLGRKYAQNPTNKDSLFANAILTEVTSATTPDKLVQFSQMAEKLNFDPDTKNNVDKKIRYQYFSIDAPLTDSVLARFGNKIAETYHPDFLKKFQNDAANNVLKVGVLMHFLESNDIRDTQLNEYHTLILDKYSKEVIDYIGQKQKDGAYTENHQNILIAVLDKSLRTKNIDAIKQIASIDKELLNKLTPTQLKSLDRDHFSPLLALLSNFNTAPHIIESLASKSIDAAMAEGSSRIQTELMDFIQILWDKTGDFTYNSPDNSILNLLSQLSHENINILLARNMDKKLSFNHQMTGFNNLEELCVQIHRFAKNHLDVDSIHDSSTMKKIQDLEAFQNKYFNEFVGHMTLSDLDRFKGLDLVPEIMALQQRDSSDTILKSNAKLEWIKSHPDLAIEFLEDTKSQFEKSHADEKGKAIADKYRKQALDELIDTHTVNLDRKDMISFTKAYMLAKEEKMEQEYNGPTR